jgi:hypothetical protein
VIVLQKDGLVMCGVTTSVPSQNVYKNGKITQSVLNKARFMSLGSFAGPSSSAGTRTFVTGEKFWITNIETKDDGVDFTLMSDPISDTRYYAVLKIPFRKGTPPPAAEMASMADQLFKVQPADNSSGGGSSGPAPAAAASTPAPPPPAPMAPIAPPPPPSDAAAVPPPTIKIGQTKAQVIAMFGAPTKVVKLSTKEIDYFPDMKVTFVHDKVSDVE